jgi:uncharacterized protein (DUF433 family)
MLLLQCNHDVNIMGSKACIAGTRITAGMILLQISEWISTDDLLAKYPHLTKSDITEALRYAAWAVGTKEELIIPA